MTVTAIYRYPVKSMLGEAVPRAVLTPNGVLGDRVYALVDTATGAIASAKVPARWAGLLGFSARFVTEPEAGLPVPPVTITFPDGSALRSDDEGVDTALSAVLGRDVALVTVPPEGSGFEELWPEIEGLAPRQLIEETTARQEDTGETISRFDLSPFGAPGTFFDLCTLHVLTESTLDRLRELAPDATFDARRYRPNIVLGPGGSGAPEAAFAENDWPGSSATIGGSARITYSFATMRCVMTTLAQGDLPDDRDTLRTIARHNRIEIPQVGGKWAVAGVYADVAVGGEIAVGDETGPRTAPDE